MGPRPRQVTPPKVSKYSGHIKMPVEIPPVRIPGASSIRDRSLSTQGDAQSAHLARQTSDQQTLTSGQPWPHPSIIYSALDRERCKAISRCDRHGTFALSEISGNLAR